MICGAAGSGDRRTELPQDGHGRHRAPHRRGPGPFDEARLPSVDSAQGAPPCWEPAGRCLQHVHLPSSFLPAVMPQLPVVSWRGQSKIDSESTSPSSSFDEYIDCISYQAPVWGEWCFSFMVSQAVKVLAEASVVQTAQNDSSQKAGVVVTL